MITIQEILDDPEKLCSLSDAELKSILEPLIPLARTQVLPEEKSRKEGLEVKHMKSLIKSVSPEQLAEMLKHNTP